MNPLFITLAVGSIAFILAAYCFGLICGRNEAVRKAKANTAGLRRELSFQQDRAYKLAQSNDQLHADNSLLRATQATALSPLDRYTIAQASHELDVAAKTFAAVSSETHAKKATELSKACLALSQRLQARQAAADAPAQQMEDAA